MSAPDAHLPPTPSAAPDRDRSDARLLLWRPVLIAMGAVLVLFGVYELVERLWLGDANEQTLKMLHLARGVLGSAVAALLVAWAILRYSPPLLAQARSAMELVQGDRLNEEQHIVRFARWFILMRWIAVAVSAALVFATVHVAHLLPTKVSTPLFGTIAVLALLNVIYEVLASRRLMTRWLLPVQVYADLSILTILLHYSGGIENPLSFVMLFHVIIGGVILHRSQCFCVAAAAAALFGVLALLEWSGLVDHYTLDIFPHFHDHDEVVHAAHQPLYAISRVSLQAMMLLLTAYFVTTLAERLRHEEQQLEQLAVRALADRQLAAVGELAGRVAHEVNNPIAIISAKVRLLLSDESQPISPKVRQELEKVTELSDRVAGIAKGLLSYCRPSAARRSRLDIRGPIRRALALVEQPATSQGIEPRDELPDAVVAVDANADEMAQVFLNLLLNALDAMPQGGRLTVAATPQILPDGRAGVAIRIRDTGIGMNASVLEQAFEPFFTTKASGKGTGLGLSICHGVIRSHGGTIDIASQPGAGTCVTVSLPLVGDDRNVEVEHA